MYESKSKIYIKNNKISKKDKKSFNISMEQL